MMRRVAQDPLMAFIDLPEQSITVMDLGNCGNMLDGVSDEKREEIDADEIFGVYRQGALWKGG